MFCLIIVLDCVTLCFCDFDQFLVHHRMQLSSEVIVLNFVLVLPLISRFLSIETGWKLLQRAQRLYKVATGLIHLRAKMKMLKKLQSIRPPLTVRRSNNYSFHYKNFYKFYYTFDFANSLSTIFNERFERRRKCLEWNEQISVDGKYDTIQFFCNEVLN